MQSPESRNYVAYIPVPINNDDDEDEDYEDEYEEDEYYDDEEEEYDDEYYYEDDEEVEFNRLIQYSIIHYFSLKLYASNTKHFPYFFICQDSDEDYYEEEETRPIRRRKKPTRGIKRKNRYSSYNSNRRRPFNDDDRERDKFRNRKDSSVKKERIPFLVPLMMVPENQVLPFLLNKRLDQNMQYINDTNNSRFSLFFIFLN